MLNNKDQTFFERMSSLNRLLDYHVDYPGKNTMMELEEESVIVKKILV